MEREGIYYYFEQGDDRETLVITDNLSFHPPLGDRPVRYYPQTTDGVSAHDAFRSFTCRHGAVPSSVRLKDYDYSKPALDVSGQASVSPRGTGEI